MGIVEVEVNVTADDTHLGDRKDPADCAIARALHRLGLEHAKVSRREAVALLLGAGVALPFVVVPRVDRANVDYGRVAAHQVETLEQHAARLRRNRQARLLAKLHRSSGLASSSA